MRGYFRHTSTIRNCRSFGCVLLLNQIYLTTICCSTIHSDLSDQSAEEIAARITVRLSIALYQHFFTENNETSTLASVNFTEGNILLKERTQTINNKIKLHIL